MNMHVPQSVQTMNELKDFALVPYHIIGPKDGKPIIEVVQDTMVGSFRLTKDDVKINDKTFANLQMVNSYFDGNLQEPNDKKTREYTGRQASSAIIPPGLHIKINNRLNETININNSVHTTGILDKNVFHSMSNGLLPVIYHDYNPFEVRRFLDNLQRLICRWLLTSGFSVGISDLVVEQTTKETLKNIITEMKTKAYGELEKVRNQQMENNSIFNNQDFFEQTMINILNGAASKVEKSGLENIHHQYNRMINMVRSGSKGKDTNVAQMIAAVGQQNVDGKRVAYGFTDRTLPHYNKYDDGPAARGFVENSFINGLTPQEMFFHAMGGREGLIDTAVKTSETGYIQRRLVKAMEDAKIHYDYTVRNAANSIIQFVYGEDGIEGTKIEKQTIPYIDMDIAGIYNKYMINEQDNMKLLLTDKAYEEFKKDKSFKKDMEKYLEQIIEDKKFLIEKIFKGEQNNKIEYPIPFTRIINNAYNRMKDMGLDSLPSNVTPKYILDKMNTLISGKDSLYIIDNYQGIEFLYILIRANISPKDFICKYHMQKETVDWIFDEIKRYFIEAIAAPGEMVGIIAAQSFGEPVTQLSSRFDTRIRVVSKNNHHTGNIGDFIDRLLEENKEDVIELGHNSTALYLKDDYFIIGVSDNEKTSWRRILEVSRHPANGGPRRKSGKRHRGRKMIHNQTFLNKICALSQVQIDRHVSRHGSFLVARDFMGTQTLGLSQAKIDGCMVDITFPTPYWVNGTSYPSRVSTRQSRKTLPVVWRGSTTGGGIAQNTDWKRVSLGKDTNV